MSDVASKKRGKASKSHPAESKKKPERYKLRKLRKEMLHQKGERQAKPPGGNSQWKHFFMVN